MISRGHTLQWQVLHEESRRIGQKGVGLFWVVTWFAQRLNDRQPFAGNHYRLTGVLLPDMALATGFGLSSLRKL